mmetsp:Transcript_18785/g.52331  ORF Transcript_18785/g.52331 Transcript_18785/m.52331 type:complete len:297 (+) Transcript_18785:133-1023(+)
MMMKRRRSFTAATRAPPLSAARRAMSVQAARRRKMSRWSWTLLVIAQLESRFRLKIHALRVPPLKARMATMPRRRQLSWRNLPRQRRQRKRRRRRREKKTEGMMMKRGMRMTMRSKGRTKGRRRKTKQKKRKRKQKRPNQSLGRRKQRLLKSPLQVHSICMMTAAAMMESNAGPELGRNFGRARKKKSGLMTSLKASHFHQMKTMMNIRATTTQEDAAAVVVVRPMARLGAGGEGGAATEADIRLRIGRPINSRVIQLRETISGHPCSPLTGAPVGGVMATDGGEVVVVVAALVPL